MDFFLFCICYCLLLIGLIGVLLFGESPFFRRTPVSWLHWAITEGSTDGLQFVVRNLCGDRGINALEGIMTYCCDRPNPIMQIAYLTLMSAGYFLYMLYIFPLLPGNSKVGSYHIFTGTACMALCLVCFVVASLSDPGRVTADNVKAHHALYRLDGCLFTAKYCKTCLFERPARSKHCSVCSMCVARHDHHCGWINNCVGLLNLRYFLAFLASNIGICAYGVVVGALALSGELDRRGVLAARRMDWARGEAVPVLQGFGPVLQWLVVVYPIPVALIMFLGLAGLLLLGFLTYQMVLLHYGRTQYEVYKWRDIQNHLAKIAAVAGGDKTQPLNNSTLAGGDVAASASGTGGGTGGRTRLPDNIYKRGFKQGLFEIMFPEFSLRTALQKQR